MVGGVAHNTNAHQMAAGSEMDILARTTQAGDDGGESGGRVGGGSSATAAGVKSGQAGLSVLASLHRKLIVRQVTEEGGGGAMLTMQCLLRVKPVMEWGEAFGGGAGQSDERQGSPVPGKIQ